MVEDRNPDEFTDLGHAIGEIDIGLARLWISARMVVGDDHRVGPSTYSLPEQLPGMDVDLRKTSDCHAEHIDDVLARVEQDRREVLLLLASDGMSEEVHDILGLSKRVLHRLVATALIADPHHPECGGHAPGLGRGGAEPLQRRRTGILEAPSLGKRIDDLVRDLLGQAELAEGIDQGRAVAEFQQEVVGDAFHDRILPGDRAWYDAAVIDAREAAAYNGAVRGKLWNQVELPAPYSMATVFPADGEAFAQLVGAFQILAGLKVDGKLGSDSLGAMRTTFQVAPAPVVVDEADDDDEQSLELPLVQPPPPLVGRTGVSNCFRIGGKSIPAPEAMVAAGISVSNFEDDDEHHFDAWQRRKPCKWFVNHESVSMSQKSTIRTLEAKKRRSIRKGKNSGRGYPYGIHLIGAPDGHLSCHADLLDETVTHASQLNHESVGCEWVNPYNPKWAKPPFDEVIPAPWWCWVPKDAQPLYTLPTPAQMVAVVHLTKFLTDHLPDLPLIFPTASLGPGNGRIKNWKKPRRKKPETPGIVAHRDFSSHADGRYLLEHLMRVIQEVA